MSQTAQRYAKALFETALTQGGLEAVQSSLAEIKKLIVGLVDLRRFLDNPILSYEERCGVLKALFERRVPEITFKFLTFITYKGRLPILGDIIESFDELYLSNTHQMRALIKTALPVKEEDKISIDLHLRDKFHQEMITEWALDPSLIGGFRIFIHGNIYDYSYKGQLNHFLQQATR